MALYVHGLHQLQSAVAGRLLLQWWWQPDRLLLLVVGGLFETEIVKFSVKNKT